MPLPNMGFPIRKRHVHCIYRRAKLISLEPAIAHSISHDVENAENLKCFIPGSP